MPTRTAHPRDREHGFSLVEILVVIIIIGVIAAIAIPVFLNQREKAARADTRANQRNVLANIVTARENKQQNLKAITGSGYSVGQCMTLDPLPKVTDSGFTTTACGVRWATMADNIAAAAGTTSAEMRALLTDGWGHPMLFDENEGETTTSCNSYDVLYSGGPGGNFLGTNPTRLTVQVPLSGFC